MTVSAFTFGDPEPVLGRASLFDLLECPDNGRWYEPPLPFGAVSRAFRAAPHHESAIYLKRNMLVGAFQPTPWLSRSAFAGLALDYLVFGNGWVREVKSRGGDVVALEHLLAKYMRVGVEGGGAWWVPGWKDEMAIPGAHHLKAGDLNQEIYGVPEYLGALQSTLLNENATLFRRRYFENGSHAGYILYATGEFNEGDIDSIREALKKSKGPGNFRNLFVHSPHGKESGLKLLPIAEVAAKDDFAGIKNVTRDDVLAAHRVPPQLLGIVPANTGGFGDVTKAADVFYELEIVPLQAVLLRLNEEAGVEAVRFAPRERLSTGEGKERAP